MFQYSRRNFAALENSQVEQVLPTPKASSVAPTWAKSSVGDMLKLIAQTNLASACPYCVNYNLAAHHCDLYGEPIPQNEDSANPCKGNTFSRKLSSGNRLAQLRALRG